MHSKLTNILLALTAAAVFATCSTQSSSLLRGKIPQNANKYQEDFLQLAVYVKKTHPGFYSSPLQVMSFEQYEELVNAVYQRMGIVKNDDEWKIELSWFLEKLKDGHTIVDWPIIQKAPIGIWWFGDRLYVVFVDDKKYEAMLYKEVTKIGAMEVLQLEQRINEYVSADKGQLLYKRLFNPDLMLSLPYLSYLGLADASGITIEYLDNGKTSSIKMPLNQFTRGTRYRVRPMLRNATTVPRNSNYFIPVPEHSAVYMQLGRLPKPVDANLYAAAFKLAKESNYNNLILDLRGNGGGDSTWCDALLPYIIKQNRNVYIYKGWKSSYPSANREITSGYYAVDQTGNGLRFGGKLYVLSDAGTFSSATFFITAIKDNGLGTIIGEPCGNTSIRFGNRAASITLKNSGMQFSTTNSIWARAKPGAIESEPVYIDPDVLVVPTLADFQNRNDPVIAKAYELIDSSRTP